MRKKYTEVERVLMEEMATNLRAILIRKNISQKELAEITNLSTSAISDYINAKTLMSPGNIQIISDALNVRKGEIDPTFRGTVDMVAKETSAHYNTAPYSVDTVNLPVVGRISCGNGMFTFEDIERYEATPKEWLAGGEYFYLRAKGDSMTGARIFDGDYLLIRKQEDVENGEIAAVIVNDEAFLKRVYKNGNQVILHSENAAYQPIFCPPNEARIVGKLKKIIINL